MRNNKKFRGFTLIELIAVLVIMAIIALIVTPLVMNIIRKARISADKRSVDAYGRSIELAIAGYLLDTGKFPTEVSQLTIEYSGSQVVCETTQINTDSSVYLAGCKVAGRSVENYTYGSDKSPTYTAYTVGNQVTYNGVDYYVIKDSGTKESTVTLLKAEPLSVQEVNTYGAGHVNRYTSSSVGTAYNSNGYGGMQYYSSSTCGYNGSSWVYDGCTTNYAQSEIKYVVDAWKNAKAPAATEARLITFDELKDNLGYELIDNGSVQLWSPTDSTPSWVYNSNYWYWTSTQYNDSSSIVWFVSDNGSLGNSGVSNLVTGGDSVVRPVITISKSNISNTGN
jgi:prepilin-type N-terminal cleavage/methylation domain-containing protein